MIAESNHAINTKLAARSDSTSAFLVALMYGMGGQFGGIGSD